MLKISTLVFALGLVLGLWVGFNPQAHERAVQNWDNMRSSLATLKVNISNTTHNWALSLNASGQKNGQGQKITTTTIWKQTSSIFTIIWDGVRNIWTDITIQLHTKR